jgi:hypothetical protein
MIHQGMPITLTMKVHVKIIVLCRCQLFVNNEFCKYFKWLITAVIKEYRNLEVLLFERKLLRKLTLELLAIFYILISKLGNWFLFYVY